MMGEEVRVLVLFDLKRRVSQNRTVFGRLAKAKDELNVVAQLGGQGTYEYVMYLDKTLFMRMADNDRIHLIRHELSHALGDENKDGDLEWKIQGHHYELFDWETTKPDWKKRILRWSEMAAALYDSEAPLPAELPPTDKALVEAQML
jgi:hypothetical protein